MVGLVLVAHSPELVRGVAAMIAQAAPGVPVEGAGGLSGGRLGTSAPDVTAAIRRALARSDPDGVLVFLDLGSAALAVEIAVEDLEPDRRALVRVTEAAFVEGAILAAIEASRGGDADAVALAAMRGDGLRKLVAD